MRPSKFIADVSAFHWLILDVAKIDPDFSWRITRAKHDRLRQRSDSCHCDMSALGKVCLGVGM